MKRLSKKTPSMTSAPAYTDNPRMALAYDFVLHTRRNVFLTGKAGTGKTTFLRRIRSLTAKRLAIVAPTGVAAINAGGVTIHSFFQLPFGPIVPGTGLRESRKFNKEKIKLLRSLDLLVIDEISMVRADVLDAIDEVLRRYRGTQEAFGGVQLLMIGDMQQLPPVIKDEEWLLLRPHYESAYFFGSRALRETPYVSIELTHIYRQSDERFIAILNAIREKQITRTQLEELNRRHLPDFTPDDTEGYITLSTHNTAAQLINQQKLEALDKPAHRFEATIEGDFPAHAYPTEAILELKVGAQVMFVKNDITREKRYYNGKIGRITAIDEEAIYVRCPDEREELAVTPVSWENIRYALDGASREIKAEVVGTFTQYPLKLAWAITIHKSQGLTFEKAIIDAAAAFAHGQVYVALSRCKTLEGIVLRAPIPAHSIKSELTLESFHEQVQQQTPTETELRESRRSNQYALLDELFDFNPAMAALRKCRSLTSQHAGSLDETLAETWTSMEEGLIEKALSPGERFRQQLRVYAASEGLPEENEALQERLKKASTYFRTLLGSSVLPLLAEIEIFSDNQQVRDALQEALQETEKRWFVKLRCFEALEGGFEALSCLRARNDAELDFQPKKPKKEDDGLDGRDHSPLFRALVKWRKDLAGENDVPAYVVLHQKTLLEIVREKPRNAEELMAVKGFGKTKMRQFGDDILALIKTYGDE